MVALGSRGCLTLVGAGELILKRDHRTLDVAVSVAGATTATVEAACRGDAAGGGAGGAGVERCGHAGWGGGLWCADKVAGATAAGVNVGVLCHRGVRLGDGVSGHVWRDFVQGVIICVMYINGMLSVLTRTEEVLLVLREVQQWCLKLLGGYYTPMSQFR